MTTRFRLPIDVKNWLRDREYRSPVQRLSEAIEQVLLESIRENIIYFLRIDDRAQKQNCPRFLISNGTEKRTIDRHFKGC